MSARRAGSPQPMVARSPRPNLRPAAHQEGPLRNALDRHSGDQPGAGKLGPFSTAAPCLAEAAMRRWGEDMPQPSQPSLLQQGRSRPAEQHGASAAGSLTDLLASTFGFPAFRANQEE